MMFMKIKKENYMNKQELDILLALSFENYTLMQDIKNTDYF